MTTKPSDELVKLVAKIQRDVETTNPQFAGNFVSKLNTHPIPYFGRLESAEILTVGLNPSPGEFQNGRWPHQPLAAARLACELHDYFHRGDFSSHPWFDKWSVAISSLNESLQYGTGRVAHVDLCPRATTVASQVSKPEVFAKMVQHDLQWLPDLLECAKAAQILLIAGAVNKRKYLIEFLAQHGQENGISVVRHDDRGRRSLGFYELHFRSRRLPVFFSGSSPSARDRGAKLAHNISAHREQILTRMLSETA